MALMTKEMAEALTEELSKAITDGDLPKLSMEPFPALDPANEAGMGTATTSNKFYLPTDKGVNVAVNYEVNLNLLGLLETLLDGNTSEVMAGLDYLTGEEKTSPDAVLDILSSAPPYDEKADLIASAKALINAVKIDAIIVSKGKDLFMAGPDKVPATKVNLSASLLTASNIKKLSSVSRAMILSQLLEAAKEWGPPSWSDPINEEAPGPAYTAANTDTSSVEDAKPLEGKSLYDKLLVIYKAKDEAMKIRKAKGPVAAIKMIRGKLKIGLIESKGLIDLWSDFEPGVSGPKTYSGSAGFATNHINNIFPKAWKPVMRAAYLYESTKKSHADLNNALETATIVTSLEPDTPPTSPEIDGIVDLRDAKKLFQPVKGSDSGSVYFAVALSSDLKVACRVRKDGYTSIRVDGDALGKTDLKSRLTDAGLSPSPKGHWSAHFTAVNEGISKRTLGAILFATEHPFEKMTTNIQPIIGEGA